MRLWYLLGMLLCTALFGFGTLLYGVGGGERMLVLASFLVFVAALVGCTTGWGYSYTYQAGWSHAMQQPWTIEAGPSRWGALASGYITLPAVVYVCFMVYMMYKALV